MEDTPKREGELTPQISEKIVDKKAQMYGISKTAVVRILMGGASQNACSNTSTVTGSQNVVPCFQESTICWIVAVDQLCAGEKT